MTAIHKSLFFRSLWAILLYVGAGSPLVAQGDAVNWPVVDSETKAWTRWWWHGSAVTEAGITAELTKLAAAGFGGVELTPIFGTIGEEDDFVDYLSPRWVELLQYTLGEAERLGLQVDMATGTGWPFGGPWVTREDAAKYLAHQVYHLNGGERLSEKVSYEQQAIDRRSGSLALEMYRRAEAKSVPYADVDGAAVMDEIRRQERTELAEDFMATEDMQALAVDQIRFARPLPLVTLMAYGPDGQTHDLTEKVGADGTLDWEAPAGGDWILIALFQGDHGKMVERAAPGGEGLVIDHFSTAAIRHYLDRFGAAFTGGDVGGLRAFFNDSYEVDDAYGQANWTPDFLREFEQRRGYDLRDHLAALLAEEQEAVDPRILSDVRETFSELLLETFTRTWDGWADSLGARIRNQAHGSPANILDLYAASDIPEAEGTEPLRIKFASSAAHVTGKPLASAEAATWLGEHFTSNWADLKENLDGYFANGVNHVVYHGTAYSPEEDAFPGRLFYAAFHANDRNPMWGDLKTVNDYVSRTQSLLQAGKVDNDVLLYFPVYDRFATPDVELLQHFDGHGRNLDNSAVGRLGEQLLDEGYAFDFISDRQLGEVEFSEGLRTPGGTYRTLVIPRTRYMPLPTLEKIMDLARAGATVVFEGAMPASVPGYKDWEKREADLRALVEQVETNRIDGGAEADFGEGTLLVAGEVTDLLPRVGALAEPLVQTGLRYNRLRYQDGTLYFVVNPTSSGLDGWLPLAAEGSTALLLDPMTGQRGRARSARAGDAMLRVWVNLAPGQSTFVWVGEGGEGVQAWPYFQPNGIPQELAGNWELSFVRGGPALPGDTLLSAPAAWNDLGGEDRSTFSGTGRYTLRFPRPENAADAYRIDLGRVFETARVYLNGDSLTTLIGPEYAFDIPADDLLAQNTLTVEVSNRMINRIIDLDRRKIFWKRFYNTNFPSRLAGNRGPLGIFDAADWEPVASGLAGPVTITPGRFVRF